MYIVNRVSNFPKKYCFRVNGMDWPVGNRFHGIDMEFVLNFRKKVLEERNDLDIEFEVTRKEN